MLDNDTPKLDDYVKVKMLNSVEEVFDTLASGQFRSGHWVFRGQGNEHWPLLPSLERFARCIVDQPGPIERHGLREFQRRAHHYATNLPDDNSALEWLALMRHHGSPTRLLDFTKSPYVAAFFATVDANGNDAAAIWAIDAVTLKAHAAEVLKTEHLNVLVSEIGKQCLNGASFSDPKIFNKLLEGKGPMPSVVAPVEPFKFNKRMVLQQGLFLCPFGRNRLGV